MISFPGFKLLGSELPTHQLEAEDGSSQSAVAS